MSEGSRHGTGTDHGFGYLQEEGTVAQDEQSARIANWTLNGLNSN
ncbi:hypothetical protein ACODM8_11815 [Vibrio ostreicida]|uniref:Uncharacterized protein n=1 Tax=Vibrio ostreicida TaxID=526588 RepID=A0ABT8BRK0_9VIBR|nr:hypothetical protein [Vibrio ostreicida]MDN3608740.1 hypothetical protein [Vibrio ostreicida]